jgi:biopolymer transport protein ExbB
MKYNGTVFFLKVLCCLVIVWMVSPVAGFGEEKADDSMMSGVETIGDPMALPKTIPATSNRAAADNDVKDSPAKNVSVMSMLDIIMKGGIVGYLIILLSIVGLGLIIDYTVTIRKSKILPSKDIEKIKNFIDSGNLTEIENMDHERASFLTKVSVAGIRESEMGYASMIKAMEDTAEALTSKIARKIEHLNVIGNISPMMGLLGTVIGMLRCFNEIAHVAGAIEPKQLAGGIFEALITTCMGLIVAIPALYGYAVFRNRIDEYTGEAALEAERLMATFKSGSVGD